MRKRSGGRSSKKPPKPRSRPIFFFDENMGRPDFSDFIAAGAEARSYHDLYPPGVPDHVWIPEVTARGWVIVTTDRNIRYRPNERWAIEQSGARMFVFTGAQMRGEQQMEVLTKALPKMLRTLDKHRPPFIAVVDRSGGVTVRWPKR